MKLYHFGGSKSLGKGAPLTLQSSTEDFAADCRFCHRSGHILPSDHQDSAKFFLVLEDLESYSLES